MQCVCAMVVSREHCQECNRGYQRCPSCGEAWATELPAAAEVRAHACRYHPRPPPTPTGMTPPPLLLPPPLVLLAVLLPGLQVGWWGLILLQDLLLSLRQHRRHSGLPVLAAPA